jgi:hypothetical protein
VWAAIRQAALDVTLVRAGTALVVLLATFHALIVVAVNAPPNAIKDALLPLTAFYSGPQVNQNWSLFAPSAPHENLHVLARAHMMNGSLTPWFDVTLFFHDEMEANRLTTYRPLSEGVFHSASIEYNHRSYEFTGTVGLTLLRTSAMVVRRYVPGTLSKIQLEVDGSPIGFSAVPQRRDRMFRSPWVRFPDVIAI